jgi:5'(3')-deoxyribonucleotidase
MSKKVIAIDVDDVLAAGAQGFVSFSNDTWGTNLTVEDYDERWAVMWGVDHEEEKLRAQQVHDSGITEHFKVIDEAYPVLKKLKSQYTFVITTSRVTKVKDYTLKWIEENYPDIFDEVHFAGLYDTLTKDSHKLTKAALVRSIGADFLVDDQPKHCFAAAGFGVKAILFGDYSWNRSIELPDGVARCTDWEQVLEYFDGRNR